MNDPQYQNKDPHKNDLYRWVESDNSDGTIKVSWWSWGSNQTPITMSKEQLSQSTYFYGSFE